VLQAQHKDLNNAAVSRLLGSMWNSMLPEQRQPYVETATKIKSEFEAAHPDYVYTKTPRKHKKRQISSESAMIRSQQRDAFGWPQLSSDVVPALPLLAPPPPQQQQHQPQHTPPLQLQQQHDAVAIAESDVLLAKEDSGVYQPRSSPPHPFQELPELYLDPLSFIYDFADTASAPISTHVDPIAPSDDIFSLDFL